MPGTRVTDPVCLRVKELANRFFDCRKPYSSARISNGTFHRLSYGVGTKGNYRYCFLTSISPEDRQLLDTKVKKFQKLLRENGIFKVEIHFHIKAGVYISIRTPIGMSTEGVTLDDPYVPPKRFNVVIAIEADPDVDPDEIVAEMDYSLKYKGIRDTEVVGWHTASSFESEAF